MIEFPDEPQPEQVAPAETLPAVAQPVAKAPKPAPKAKSSASPSTPAVVATGRRKEAIARVRLLPGVGQFVINHQPYERYFPREVLRLAIRQPLIVTQQLGKQDVFANVVGGGLTGQAGAVRLGVARALVQLDPALRGALRAAGLLTRDPRMKERKKYGQKGARKRFQWTKR